MTIEAAIRTVIRYATALELAILPEIVLLLTVTLDSPVGATAANYATAGAGCIT